jgi:hypothetical protein
VAILLKGNHFFLIIDIATVDTFLLPLSYRWLILLMCLLSEMAYLAVLSPHAASISLLSPVSFAESELTDGRTLTLEQSPFFGIRCRLRVENICPSAVF